jgi:histidine triad (HIT) family protein
MSTDADCIFCKILRGEIPATKVHEDDHVFAFEDLNPGAPCHVLVIPKTHIATNNDVAEGDVDTVGRLFLGAKAVAAAKGVTDYRMVMNAGAGAGQSVFHLHLHVLGGRDLSWPPG